MIILPAIDLFNSKAVRLLKGDYSNMTVYDENPVNTAMKFKSEGAEWIHIVDLEGARSGETVNLETIIKIKNACNLKCEVGGGIRNLKIIESYIKSGIDRVILGTAAVTEKNFVEEAIKNFGEKIAVGADIKNNSIAIKGWLENANINALDFCEKMQDAGVKTLICTDISKDGAMKGTNISLYENLNAKFNMNIIASGGVSSLDDVKNLAKLNLYGAIIGKAYYTGAVKIKEVIEAAKS